LQPHRNSIETIITPGKRGAHSPVVAGVISTDVTEYSRSTVLIAAAIRLPSSSDALAIKELLGENFGGYAARFVGMNPVFEGYEGFAEILEFFAAGSCGGCRKQGCLFQACRVKDCVREHGVDFCFECGEFPCERHGFPEGLKTVGWPTTAASKR